MRRFVQLAVPFLVLLVMSLPARADFIKNFEEWRRLGPDGQAAYGMAIFDVMTVVTADNKYTAARALGLRACAIGLQMRAGMIAQAINQFYLDHPNALSATPFVAFNSYFERGACSPFINKARQEMGLPEMKAPPPPDQQQQQQGSPPPDQQPDPQQPIQQ